MGVVPDVHLPVTLPILSRLVVAMPTVFSSHNKCLILQAMMVLAFKAYLRVGEMIPQSRRMVRGWMCCCLAISSPYRSDDLSSAQQSPQSLQVTDEGIPDMEIYPARFLREFLIVSGAVRIP